MAIDIQARIQRAISAAQSGDRATALQILQQVVVEDPRNETAWLWLASVSNSREDKRKCLLRVLQINPENTTAREGLRRLQSGEAMSPPPRRQRLRLDPATLRSVGIFVAVILSVVFVVIIVVNAVRTSVFIQDADLAPAEVAERMTQTIAAQPTTTATPTDAPTPTPPVVLVSPRPVTLPPTFTPTDAPTATATPTPTATQVPLSTYDLLYTSFSGEDGRTIIYRIQANGERQTSLAIDTLTMAPSPQGNRLAYVQPVTGGENIFVAPLGDLEAAVPVLTSDPPVSDITSLAWSPDGLQIAFISEQGTQLNIVSISDQQTRPLLAADTRSFKRDVAWSPDGTRLAFASDQNNVGFTEIFTYTLEDETVTALTDSLGSSFGPAWSPDSSQIAFTSDRSGDSDLYIMAADGTSPRLVTTSDGGAEDQAPAWSADGAWLAFASNRNTDTFQIFLINPQGTQIEAVTDDSRTNRAPRFLQ